MEGIHFQQTFQACFDCLSDVGTLIHKAAKSAGLDERSTYQVETSVDEACSNSIEHAYNGEYRGDIQVICISQPGVLTIKLLNNGKRFKSEHVESPELGLSLGEHPDCDLGLFFTHRWMDSMHFEFLKDESNVLTMVKKTGQAL